MNYIYIYTHREIFADKKRLQQIILNLLSNALKFTSVGQIKLKYWTEPPFIYFKVSDTGVGIKEENIHKLFQPFEMIEETKNINKYGN